MTANGCDNAASIIQSSIEDKVEHVPYVFSL